MNSTNQMNTDTNNCHICKDLGATCRHCLIKKLTEKTNEVATSRTDAAAGHAMGIINEGVLFCSRQIERELLAARDDNFNLANALSKAEAEVDRLKEELRLAVMLAEEVADEWVDPDFCDDSPEFIKLRSCINQIKETLNPADK